MSGWFDDMPISQSEGHPGRVLMFSCFDVLMLRWFDDMPVSQSEGNHCRALMF